MTLSVGRTGSNRGGRPLARNRRPSIPLMHAYNKYDLAGIGAFKKYLDSYILFTGMPVIAMKLS